MNEMAQSVIAEVQATSMADLGKVMKAFYPKFGDRPQTNWRARLYANC